MQDQTQQQLDPDAVNLAKAIRQTESGGNFNAKGKSGEYGAYQYTPDTWKSASSKYGINTTIDKATPEQQNEVTYRRIKEWKDAGYNPGQIASMWNAGEKEPDAYTGKFGTTTKTHKAGDSSVGVNSYGAISDVPAYAKSVANAYHTIKNGGQITQDLNNPSAVNSNTQAAPLTQPTTLPEDTTLKADTGKGFVGKTIGLLGDVSGVTKLGEGLGYGLSNLMGTQKGLIKTNEQAIDIQGKLINQIKQNKAQGKDTSKLEQALSDISQNIQKTGSQASDVGTGGISNADVLKSAVQTGVTVATLPSLISGGVSLLKGAGLFKSPVIEEAMGKFKIPMSEFNTLSNGEKYNALSESLKTSTPIQKKVLQQAIDTIEPLAVKEAGGIVEFAKLHPNIAKVGGLLKGVVKRLGGLATGVAIGTEGRNIYNNITKHL